jgi:hypothetical protein
MKITIAVVLAIIFGTLLDIAAGFFIFQSEGDALWKLVERWAMVIGAVTFICGAAFAAWRGNSYKELERLAATRKEEIADLTLKLARRDERIRRLEDDAEYEKSKKLRQQGDEDYNHRSKAE